MSFAMSPARRLSSERTRNPPNPSESDIERQVRVRERASRRRLLQQRSRKDVRVAGGHPDSARGRERSLYVELLTDVVSRTIHGLDEHGSARIVERVGRGCEPPGVIACGCKHAWRRMDLVCRLLLEKKKK